MDLTIRPMGRQEATQIATWSYAEPYDLYSMDGSEADILELLNGDYAVAVDRHGEIAGFYCTGNSARISGGYEAGIYEDEAFIDFGLGMEPGLTGQGRGLAFVQEGMDFVLHKFPGKHIRLMVASFNQRAVKVYEKAGFEKVGTVSSMVNRQTVEFICMTAKNDKK